jgi:acyl-CoA thioester hydrolase
MPRIKIDLPEAFQFTTHIPIRITDLNYGNHVGNDAILSIIHEARMQYLAQAGFTELQFAGVGIIMSDVGIEFKSELFYGDTVIASVTAGEISKIAFELYYKLEKESAGNRSLVAAAKTGMVCYDYGNKKVVAIPAAAKALLEHR